LIERTEPVKGNFGLERGMALARMQCKKASKYSITANFLVKLAFAE